MTVRAASSGEGGGGSAGRYELREPLGSGGMGQVYRAFDTVLRRDVALKLLRADLTPGSAGQARLLREARMAANLSHPNICTLHDVGEMDGRPFLTMELLSGETLRRRLIRDPRMPAESALRIGREVATALAEAHARGVIHRDIKPENIMILPDGRVKVLDFGLAKAIDAVIADRPSDDLVSHVTTQVGLTPVRPQTLPAHEETLTTPGQILGTYHYLSPEQAEAKPADARSDVFSLGVVLYEMLAGAKPFNGPTAEALLAAIRAGRPIPLEKASPKAPAALVSVVQRCLKREPGDRFEGGAGLTEALAGVERALARRTRVLWAAGAAIVVTMGVVGGAVLWRGDASRDSRDGAAIAAGGGSVPRVRRLTFDGKAGEPFFSPDGSMIAYRRNRADVLQALVIDAGGGPPRNITDVPEGFQLHGWNREGDGLIGNRGRTPGLWEVPLDGGKPTLFLEKAGGNSIDRIHGRIAYVYWNSDHHSDQEIRLRDLPTGVERTLRKLQNPSQSLGPPRWDSTGRAIAHFYSEGNGGHAGLVIQGFDGNEGRTVELHGLVSDGTAEWSADDRHLLTGAGDLGYTDLWMFPVGGGAPRQITSGAGWDKHPDMSPDGKSIAFTRQQHGSEVVLVDIATGGMTDVFPTAAWAFDPWFTPDGTRLLLAHSVSGPGTVLSIPFAGGAPRNLTDDSRLSCESPLALDDQRVALLCQERKQDPLVQGPRWEPDLSIWTTGIDGGSLEKVDGVEGASVLFAVDPITGRLVYESTLTDRRALRLLDVDTGETAELMHLSENEGVNYVTAFQGGFRVVLRGISLGRWARQMRIVEIALGEVAPREIASYDVEGTWAALSPDGRWLAYSAGPHDRMEVWIQDVPPTLPARQLTRFGGEVHPHRMSFSPDGRILAVERVMKEMSDIYLIEGF